VTALTSFEQTRMQDELGTPLYDKYSRELNAALADFNKK
jgi:hypothetical protein